MEYSYSKIGEYKGKDLIKYTLKNKKGIEISVLNLGGIITEILTPDKHGKSENIVIGYGDIHEYFVNDCYYGALIGRFAGRIYDGKLTINNEEYALHKNHLNASNLHGGSEGFQRQIWDVEPFKNESEVGVILRYFSKDGEEGFPGNVTVEVKYVLNNSNELLFLIEGKTDKETVLNITNHSYFNLSGNGRENILNHKLLIDSDNYLEISEVFVPTGKDINVKETPFDFTILKKVGQDIGNEDTQINRANGYDHPFKFNKTPGVATLIDEKSGRSLEVITDNSYVVVYTTNYPSDKIMANGMIPEKNMAICLETQNAPIGLNQCNKEESLLKPQEKYTRYTRYKFDILNS